MNDWKTFLFGLSIGLNIAFLAVWGFFVLEDTLDRYGVVEEHHGTNNKHWDRDKRHGHGGGEWFYREKLGVSETQWNKIEPRLKAFHRKAYDLCRKIGERRNELLGLIASDTTPDTAIKKKKEEILDLRRRKQTMAIDYFGEKKSQLTPSQQSTFFEMLRRKPHCEKHMRLLGQNGKNKRY